MDKDEADAAFAEAGDWYVKALGAMHGALVEVGLRPETAPLVIRGLYRRGYTIEPIEPD